jgi:hypothetical protein
VPSATGISMVALLVVALLVVALLVVALLVVALLVASGVVMPATIGKPGTSNQSSALLVTGLPAWRG